MTKRDCFIAVDIGTQGIKTALISDRGVITASSFAASSFISKGDGSIQQSPDVIFQDVLTTVKDVIQSSGVDALRICAVGIDGMMAGILGIDNDWNPVFPYDSGLDKRCGTVIVEMQRRGEDRVVSLSGSPIIVAQGAKIFWWKENYPGLCDKQVKKFIPVSTYVVGRMGGLKASEAFIDYTHIHLTSLADVQKCEWAEPLMNLFDVNCDKLPRICNPWDVVAHVTPQCAGQTGLLAGTPIVAGCGDTAASAFGAGVVTPGSILDVAGTASVMAACVDRYIPDIERKMIICPRAVVPGLWLPFGFVLGGQCLRWYKDQIDPEDGGLWDTLEAEAGGAVNEGLFFQPFFAGRICPSEPKFAGSWVGLKFHHSRGNLYRSIMEAVAFEYRSYFDRIRELSGSSFSTVTGIGGGANSRLFAQIKSNVLGIPYQIRETKNTPLLAMMMIAGYGIGYYPDLANTAKAIAEDGRWLYPDSGADMDARYREYQRLIHELRAVYQ